jgi:predicted dehydrogenase
VKQLMEDGFVGQCRYAEFRFLGSFALDDGYKWRFDGRRANGVTGDLGSHMIDFARWYLGEPVAVRADLRTFIDQSASGDPPPQPVNDIGFLSLEFADQTRAEITASAVNLLGDEGVRVSARFYGDEGSLEVEHPYFGVGGGATIRGVRKGETSFAALSIPASFLSGVVDPSQLFDPYAKQSTGPRLFIDAIVEDRAIETDFGAGVRVQEVVDGALRSAAEDRWVRLDGQDDRAAVDGRKPSTARPSAGRSTNGGPAEQGGPHA